MDLLGWLLLVSRRELAVRWLFVDGRHDSAHFVELRLLVFLNNHLQFAILNQDGQLVKAFGALFDSAA